MRNSIKLFSLFLLAGLMQGTIAYSQGGMAAAGSPVSKQPDIRSLKWMTGVWENTNKGETMREDWKLKNRFTMAGKNYALGKDGDTTFSEEATIYSSDSGVYYAVSVNKGPLVLFKMIKQGPEVVFENKKHDYPQRIIYTKMGEQLKTRIEGKKKKEEFIYTKTARNH